ncbi:hypothetical protein GGR55DRAFT_681116 [Xylaria sp. FL0064]|nr:hypothetical protein GGR55DRAFT_681116 [Xylaria sp. FL0064]
MAVAQDKSQLGSEIRSNARQEGRYESTYGARRLENVKRNESLIRELGLRGELASQPRNLHRWPPALSEPTPKRQKRIPSQPTRKWARVAKALSKPDYAQADDEGESDGLPSTRCSSRRDKSSLEQQMPRVSISSITQIPPLRSRSKLQYHMSQALKATWPSWRPSAGLPTHDEEGYNHFDSHPSFTPNMSPGAIIREGSFGGAYWQLLYLPHLRATILGDWRELPTCWTDGLSVKRYITSNTYHAKVNKFKVPCDEDIGVWRNVGSRVYRYYDVRGWFQWYYRFWLGRRCEDDEHQINRWRLCVGEWRRDCRSPHS